MEKIGIRPLFVVITLGKRIGYATKHASLHSRFLFPLRCFHKSGLFLWFSHFNYMLNQEIIILHGFFFKSISNLGTYQAKILEMCLLFLPVSINFRVIATFVRTLFLFATLIFPSFILLQILTISI